MNTKSPDFQYIKSRLLLFLSLAVALTTQGAPQTATTTLALHPENPHYFVWRGKPTVLITSAEHYGAVLNLDFDYVKYLKALEADQLNLTRTFAGGAYAEPQGAFNIERNTLAPAPNRYITPWARSEVPGYAGGGNKFDLNRWNEQYFMRLRDFVGQASRRGIVVEMTLFCPMYEEAQWKISPFNSNNNVNNVGQIGRTNVYTLDKHGGLLPIQEKMTRRIVEELREFDNVYYEICNEPYFGGVTIPWQHHIADVITDTQKGHLNPKLISQNIANNSAKIENPHPQVSIFNFHYAAPPDAVGMNYHLNKVIGDNETGFRGTNDAPYRMEAWDFILAGGGLYNNLDYSFAVGYEDGTFVYPATQPGGGNPSFRRQIRVLRDFINGFDFIKMRPDNSVLKSPMPAGLTASVLAQPGKAYAMYFRSSLVTQFSARWTGKIEPRFSERYTFRTRSNDGARLWVNGQKIIDDWTEHGEEDREGQIQLEAGKKYDLKLEYFFNGGQAAVKLRWASASQKEEAIPANQLSSPDGTGQGLNGEYFTGANFDRPWQTRIDPQVNFSWGTKPPFDAPKIEEPIVLEASFPASNYKAEWVEPATGRILKAERIKYSGGSHKLDVPVFSEELALRVKALPR